MYLTHHPALYSVLLEILHLIASPFFLVPQSKSNKFSASFIIHAMIMKSFLLAIDAGSSSIRCTAYEYHPHHYPHGHGDGGGAGSTTTPPLVQAVEGVSHAISLEAIVPNTGHIRINEVLAAIDSSIDETLKLLHQKMIVCNNVTPDSCPYRVVAIGFSTFVMNFVALDIHGDPVGDVATCSYACNRDDVVKECQSLRE